MGTQSARFGQLRWRLAGALAALLFLSAAPAARAAEPARLPAVRLDGNYFSREGQRFLVVGAHWVPAKAAMQWPLLWDAADIEADFAQMAKMGFNTVRLDLMWAWFEPRPGDYNPEAFRQLDVLVALAHKYRIYLHPSLFVGGEVGEAYWDVPWRHGRNPQADPEMLRLETNHARELGRRYAHETAIIAWDLTDEPPFWIASDTTDAMAVNWTRLVGQALRREDHLHPIVAGVSTQDMEHGPFRPDTIADDVDFFSVHPYTIYTPELFPDPMVAERSTYGAAFETMLSGGAGKPVMVQEMGASSAQYSPENITAFDQVSLYSALAAGANGFLLWCYTDAAPAQYRKVPYLRSPHETQFGLTTWDRQMRPQGLAFQSFSKIVARMQLAGIELPPGDAAIVIPGEWSRTRGDFSRFGLTGPEITPYVSVADGGAVNGQSPSPYDVNQWVMSATLSSFILAHRAGFKPALPREADGWDHYPAVLLPSPLTATDPVFAHLHTDFWERARTYVEKGGVLYASLAANAAIPDMDSLFGARMTDTVVDSDITLKIVRAFGGLKAGDTLRFTLPGGGAKFWGTGLAVSDGEIIAVDQHGRPAIVTHHYGQGRTLLSAYPIEAWLGSTPAAFDGNETAWRLYRALREWAGLKPLIATDQPGVEASALVSPRGGYFVLANHDGAARRVHLDSTLPATDVRLMGEGDDTPVTAERGGWTLPMPAHSGAILRWSSRAQ